VIAEPDTGAQSEALRLENAALAQNKDVLEHLQIEVDCPKAEFGCGARSTAISVGAPIPLRVVNQ
jgi:hypothetical protein